jgi:hypothetical protein
MESFDQLNNHQLLYISDGVPLVQDIMLVVILLRNRPMDNKTTRKRGIQNIQRRKEMGWTESLDEG